MKKKKNIKHRIEQKTAARKHAKRKMLNSLRGSTKPRARRMHIPPSMPLLGGLGNIPGGKIGTHMKELLKKG